VCEDCPRTRGCDAFRGGAVLVMSVLAQLAHAISSELPKNETLRYPPRNRPPRRRRSASHCSCVSPFPRCLIISGASGFNAQAPAKCRNQMCGISPTALYSSAAWRNFASCSLSSLFLKSLRNFLGQVFRAGCRNKSNCFGFHDEKIRLGISLVARVNHGYPVTDSGAVGSIQTN
jgi:hypothetical protein